MVFVKVAPTDELGFGKMVGFKSKVRDILVANLGGMYYAIGNNCTHMGCSLTDGTLNGEIVQCPCHRSRFNVKTGNVVGGLAKKPEPTYQVKVEAGQIMVDLK